MVVNSVAYVYRTMPETMQGFLGHFAPYMPNETRGECPPRIHYRFGYTFDFEKDLDHARITEHMQNYWHFTLAISAFYLAAIKIMELWMRDRKPMQISTQLAAWNFGLAIFSIFGLIRTSEEMWYTLNRHGFYASICSAFHPTSVSGHWFFYFAMSKLVELGDTVFLVLRKRPLSFLHCYHHMSVLVYTFHSGAEHLAAGRWFIWMNFVAHSFMYTYYSAMSVGIRVNRSLACCVTLIQIAQMLAGVGISLILYHVKTATDQPCQQSMGNLHFAFAIYASFAFLFMRFFMRTYLASSSTGCKKKVADSIAEEKKIQ